MEATSGRENLALADYFLQQPNRFTFFQAVRLLEKWSAEVSADENAERAPPLRVGYDYAPEKEVARFRSFPSRSFPSSEIVQATELNTEFPEPEDPRRFDITVGFMGLYGPSGVLPIHYTQTVIENRNRKQGFRDFLDIFNHRIISLFYRTWKKYFFPVVLEQSRLFEDHSETEWFTPALRSLGGIGGKGQSRRFEFHDETLIYYTGLLGKFPRSASALQSILKDYFQTNIKIKQFQGHWLFLDASNQSKMPSAGDPNGMNNALGVSTIIGDRIWNVESKIRIKIGPLTYREFQGYMPLGDRIRPLAQLARHYLGGTLAFDVQLVLKKEEVPAFQLGGDTPAILGQNIWVISKTPAADVDQAVFELDGWPNN